MKTRLKVVSTGHVAGPSTRIYVETDDGEIDISDCITGVDVRLQVGELATATLRAIVYSVETEALLGHLNVERLPGWRLRLRRIAKLLA